MIGQDSEFVNDTVMNHLLDDSNNRRTLVRNVKLLVFTVTVVAMLFLIAVALLPDFEHDPRQQRRDCANQLRLVGLALQNYHALHGCFPPAYFADEHGQPMHSWRVIILPHFEGPQAQEILNRYRWDEPWDSEHNLELTQTYMPPYYVCPACNHLPGQTNYLAITGPGTAWPGKNSICEADVTDGLSTTFAICDVAGLAVHWSEPRDISVNQMLNLMRKRNTPNSVTPQPLHDGSTHFLFLDSSVRGIEPTARTDSLRALSTIAGGENFIPLF